jgi:hypothetical protein
MAHAIVILQVLRLDAPFMHLINSCHVKEKYNEVVDKWHELAKNYGSVNFGLGAKIERGEVVSQEYEDAVIEANKWCTQFRKDNNIDEYKYPEDVKQRVIAELERSLKVLKLR